MIDILLGLMIGVGFLIVTGMVGFLCYHIGYDSGYDASIEDIKKDGA